MKTVQNVKNSLKFKAQEKEGVLSVRVGVKKFNVPVTARMISGDNYLFLSFPASSELYQVQDSELVPLDRDADASDAFEALNPGRRRGGRRRAASVELPAMLQEALKSIPPGHKIGYGPDGTPRIIKTRQRGKKGDE